MNPQTYDVREFETPETAAPLPILLDCDEVLADFVGAVLKRANDLGLGRTRAEVTSWDISRALGWHGFSDDITRLVNMREFCYRLPEVPGAIAWLRMLEAEFGADRVLVCTSPWNAAWVSQRASWLEERGVPIKRQVQCSAKHWHAGYLIDDAPHHIHGDPAKGYPPRDPAQAFMIAAPWNYARAGYRRGNHAEALAWLRDTIGAER